MTETIRREREERDARYYRDGWPDAWRSGWDAARREAVLPDVVMIGHGLVAAALCVRESVDDESAARQACTIMPTGVGPWVPTPPDEIAEVNRDIPGPCPDYPNRRHMVVNC